MFRYLYLEMEIVLYLIAAILYGLAFHHYRYRRVFEREIEDKHKMRRRTQSAFLGAFFGAIFLSMLVWRLTGHSLLDLHSMGYFLAFLAAGMIALLLCRKWVPHIDLSLCFPAMAVGWVLLLFFEAVILKNRAGWEYTGSTILTLRLPWGIDIILENLIVFYLFAPFMSILIFTALAYKRSDTLAFFLMNLIIWAGGVVWEVLSMAGFNLWHMHQDRSVLPFYLFGAYTNLEEMLYYVPFASIAVLLYLHLYYRKYHVGRQRGSARAIRSIS